MEDTVKDHTPNDIIPEVKFSTKGDDIYAFVCIYDEKSVIIQSLRLDENTKIKEVTPLGVDTKVKWKQAKKGLKIKMLDYPIEEVPVLGFKIAF